MIGLVQKFKVDRNPEPYPPHKGEWFVLFPSRDVAAMEALYVYAAAVADSNPRLSRELKTWLDSINLKKLGRG